MIGFERRGLPPACAGPTSVSHLPIFSGEGQAHVFVEPGTEIEFSHLIG